MESEPDLITALFPSLSAQLRTALQSMQLAASRLAPAQLREQDPALDLEAARLDQSYYRLLRISNCLTAALWLDGSRPLHRQNRDLVELTQQLFASVDALAPLRGLECRLICPMDRHLCGVDPEGLRQALYQLLSNAFKFTPAGGHVTLELKRVPGFVRFLVTDDGPGIPPERRDHLFDHGLGEEELLLLPDRGLGLGLPLSRAIARAHGGDLELDPQYGPPGCRMLLSLPDHLTNSIGLSDVVFDYTGGFNDALMHLADAMPVEAYRLRNQ